VHCAECGYTFRPWKKHHQKDRRWLTSYLADGSSFRRLGERWKVSGSTAWRRIQRTERKNITVGTLVAFPASDDLRVLMLDAKHFLIRKKPFTLYAALDGERSVPLAWVLLPRHELREGYDRLLARLCRKNTTIAGVVSDWDPGIRAAVHDHLPNAVHQECAFHALANLLRKMGGRKLFQSPCGKELWQRVRRTVLEYGTLPEARRSLRRLEGQYSQYARAWVFLGNHLATLYRFAKLPCLAPYRTSNRMENFMGVLEQRLKSFRSLKTPDTCIKIISSLIEFKYKRPTKR
jgi:hypothetical protein